MFLAFLTILTCSENLIHCNLFPFYNFSLSFWLRLTAKSTLPQFMYNHTLNLIILIFLRSFTIVCEYFFPEIPGI